MNNELTQFYKKNNIYDVPLHLSCHHRKTCWSGLDEEKPKENNASIYLPYIGERYSEAKILVIGINMNNYGGTNAAKYLISRVKEELPTGKKKLFGNKNYKGTMFFYQFAKYVNILCHSKFKDTQENLGETLEFIAYTNHIKCSPDDRKKEKTKGVSKPSQEMWNNCGEHILKREIEILKPDYILVLGKSKNFSKLKEIFTVKRIKLNSNHIQKYDILHNNKIIECFVFPHPGVPKGINKQLFTDFKNIVK